MVKTCKVLVESLAPTLLRMLAWTWRIERTGEAGLERFRSDLPWITLLWHGRMLAMMPIKPHYGRNIGVLVSPSDDGGLRLRLVHHVERAVSARGRRRGQRGRGGPERLPLRGRLGEVLGRHALAPRDARAA